MNKQDETQEGINGYIRQIRLKVKCLDYALRDFNADKWIHTKAESLRRLAELERHLHAAIQLLPVETGANNATD